MHLTGIIGCYLHKVILGLTMDFDDIQQRKGKRTHKNAYRKRHMDS